MEVASLIYMHLRTNDASKWLNSIAEDCYVNQYPYSKFETMIHNKTALTRQINQNKAYDKNKSINPSSSYNKYNKDTKTSTTNHVVDQNITSADYMLDDINFVGPWGTYDWNSSDLPSSTVQTIIPASVTSIGASDSLASSSVGAYVSDSSIISDGDSVSDSFNSDDDYVSEYSVSSGSDNESEYSSPFFLPHALMSKVSSAFNSCKGWYENMNSTESNLEVDTFDVDFIAQTTTVSSFPSTGSTIAHYPTDSEFVHLSTGGDPDSCHISGCNDPRHVSADTYNALIEGGFLTKGFVSKEDFEEALYTQVHNVTSLDELDNDMAIARQRFRSFVKSSQHLLLIDPGATSTLTSDRDILFNYDRDGRKSLSATGHHRIHTEGAGTIKLKTDLHDDHFEISCQFAPSIVCQDGVPFTIINKGNKISLIRSPEGLYYVHSHHLLRPTPDIDNLVNYIAYTPKPTAAPLHEKLGHFHNCTTREELHACFNVDAPVIKLPNSRCESCLSGKARQKNFEGDVRYEARRPFDVIHFDIGGPISVPDPAANPLKMYLVIVDEYTRYVEVCLLKDKQTKTIADLLSFYLAKIQNQFGFNVRAAFSDNGKEFRYNLTLFNAVRTLLSHAKLPAHLWSHALEYSAQQLNHKYNAKLETSPFVFLHGYKPKLSTIHSFGCFVYWVAKPYGKKPQPRGFADLSNVFDDISNGDPFNSETDPSPLPVAELVGNAVYQPPLQGAGSTSDGHAGNHSYSANSSAAHSSSSVDHQSSSSSHTTSSAANQSSSYSHPSSSAVTSGSVVPSSVAPSSVNPSSVQTSSSFAPSSSSKSSSYIGKTSKNIKSKTVRVTPKDKMKSKVSQNVIKSIKKNTMADAKADPDGVYTRLRQRRSNIHHLAEQRPKPFVPRNYSRAKSMPIFQTAMKVELDAHKVNNTWSEVPRPAANIKEIAVQWIYSMKTDTLGKARLVLRGDLMDETMYDETYAPALNTYILRTVFSLVVQFNMCFIQMDISTAYLNAYMDKTVCIKTPPGYQKENENSVLLLNRALYGGKSCGRLWNLTFVKFISSIGFSSQPFENLFGIKVDNHYALLVLHVDDIALGGDDMNLLEEIASKIEAEYKTKRLDGSKLLGLDMVKDIDDGTDLPRLL
ncbi:unnamed protein product [Ambrosiozyma monospora]|uniref:Unnamed protein product n=1 Tax=Ambrosiozyma monospora TaxID=43982 RepID=A0A9W6YSE5_AMBMO|nr:unnamed protein product [Ambrosiozyma monospora]